MNINYNRPIVIGIDHGFGNVKTAHVCFKTGVTTHEKEPTFKSDLLVYEDKFYTIGDEHKEFIPDKASDMDYYILTLAAIARELRFRGTTSARVYVAAGLPLTWVSEQRDSFKAYLLQKPSADFSYRGKDFLVEFAGAEIYPQGFSAVADRLRDFHGVNMLCDIGNGTMNILFIRNGKPIPSQCFTEKYGVHQCMLAAWEKVRQKYGAEVDESVIEEVLRTGKADIGERYLNTIRECAQDYAEGILRRLRAHEYNPELRRAEMIERQTINTNIRLNLANEDDRRAWEYLQSMDRKEFRSYSRAVVAALNDYFSRKERLAADPFLETRERQEAFLQEIKETIQSSLQTPAAGIGALAALFQAAPPTVEAQEMSEESYDAAMDFINQL